MIHLHSNIEELNRLIKNNLKGPALDKCDEIIEDCRLLLNEHGAGSDVAKRLERIIVDTKQARSYLNQGNYKESEDCFKAIVVSLKGIFRILKLEFREIES